MQTLVILKPGWEKYPHLFHAVTKGFYVVRHCQALVSGEFWQKFYSSHVEKEYWKEMSEYLSSSPCVFIVLESSCLKGCTIELVREQVVKIRKRHNKTSKDTRNIAHASTSDEDAKREIGLVNEHSVLTIKTGYEI